MRTAPGPAEPLGSGHHLAGTLSCRAFLHTPHGPVFSVDSLLGAKERAVLGLEPLLTSIQTWLSQAPGHAP